MWWNSCAKEATSECDKPRQGVHSQQFFLCVIFKQNIAMKYKSTRGGVTGATFEDALFSGYASDGGLYVPESIPKFPEDVLALWKPSAPTYQQVVFEVVKLFVTEDELPRSVLETCIQEVYQKFDTNNPIVIHDCVDSVEHKNVNFKVVELFHGKTKSFKDYSLSLVGKLMEYFISKSKKQAIILVGTSGDTGSAAIESVRGLKGLDIIVLYPKGKISLVQELQMTTVADDNVIVFETEGSNDDLDLPIKQSFPGPGLMSINSINWVRIMIQIAHYVYLSTLEHMRPIDIYVPTGGAGNISAGLLASLLGFPINLYSSTNVNDNVETLINKGKSIIGGEVIPTYSNAMDIRNPYNVERLLYFVSDSDCATVKNIMENEKGGIVPPEVHKKLRCIVKGAMKVDTPTTLNTIKECWRVNKYLICPHTATAVAYFFQETRAKVSTNPCYIIATASPEKFPGAAEAAELSSIDSTYCASHELLEQLKTRQRKVPKTMKKGEDWLQILQCEINLIRNRKS